jgi:hypothetical protein
MQSRYVRYRTNSAVDFLKRTINLGMGERSTDGVAAGSRALRTETR